ncbi:MAG: hypothetical protein ACREPR_04645 [Brasilonema sp.]
MKSQGGYTERSVETYPSTGRFATSAAFRRVDIVGRRTLFVRLFRNAAHLGIERAGGASAGRQLNINN